MGPWLIPAALALTGVSFTGGFVTGGGAKGVSNTLKYAVLGGLALLAARELGLLKGIK